MIHRENIYIYIYTFSYFRIYLIKMELKDIIIDHIINKRYTQYSRLYNKFNKSFEIKNYIK